MTNGQNVQTPGNINNADWWFPLESSEKIDRVFSSRQKPAEVRIADGVLQLDFEVEAIFFTVADRE